MKYFDKTFVFVLVIVLFLSCCDKNSPENIIKREVESNKLKIELLEYANKNLTEEIKNLNNKLYSILQDYNSLREKLDFLEKLIEENKQVEYGKYSLFLTESTITGQIIDQTYENSVLTTKVKLPQIEESVAYRFFAIKGIDASHGTEYNSFIEPHIETISGDHLSFKIEFAIEYDELFIIIALDTVSNEIWKYGGAVLRARQGDI